MKKIFGTFKKIVPRIKLKFPKEKKREDPIPLDELINHKEKIEDYSPFDREEDEQS